MRKCPAFSYKLYYAKKRNKHQKGTSMKKRTMKSLLAGFLTAAVLATTLADFVPVQAKIKTGAAETLEALGVIDVEIGRAHV